MQRARLQSLLSAQPESKRAAMRSAAERLLDCYIGLHTQRAHLLSDLLGDQLPQQWRHYPEDDVVDRSLGYQYFYHSHSPEDRKGSAEHGHFHLFARMDDGAHVVDEVAEQRFLASLGDKRMVAGTASLLCIALDPKGMPTHLFTTNRWVTGDHLLCGPSTLRLIAEFEVKTAGPPLINKWMTALLQLFEPQVEELLVRRDRVLAREAKLRCEGGLLDDGELEVLSSIPIDIDVQIALLDA